ncbi:ubiquitin [Lecanosticta acicola]|uniref:Ubiquitin n=1 Tax=Lecanosticta acicola TaxID=111012 RepID=A0AAI8YTF9_9PEZI|nr:ubiquitin [Lecanosticta acicola]
MSVEITITLSSEDVQAIHESINQSNDTLPDGVNQAVIAAVREQTKSFKRRKLGIDKSSDNGLINSQALQERNVGREGRLPRSGLNDAPDSPSKRTKGNRTSQLFTRSQANVDDLTIYVKTLTQKTHQLHGLKPTSTIRLLKDKLGEDSGFDPDDIRFNFAGKPLEDGRTLADVSRAYFRNKYQKSEKADIQ